MDNVIVRCSGLVHNASPPVVGIPGLAAGTTVHHDDWSDEFRSRGIHLCPAYQGEKALSCEFNDVGACRVCWDHPDVPVSYMFHAATKASKGNLEDNRNLMLAIAEAGMEPDLILKPIRTGSKESGEVQITGGPMLVSRSEPVYPPKHNGKPWRIKPGKYETTLFTVTSKMNALSWSVRAGHPDVTGGVCFMAEEYAFRHWQNQDAGFKEIPYPVLKGRYMDRHPLVCDMCYAQGNNFRYDAPARKQCANTVWSGMLLDPKNDFRVGYMAGQLSKAYSHMFGKEKSLLDTARVRLSYFRFFDSGDLGHHSERMLEELLMFASDFPATRFWLPTRMWIYRETRRAMSRLFKRFGVKP